MGYAASSDTETGNVQPSPRRDVRTDCILSEVAVHFGISQPYLSKLFRMHADRLSRNIFFPTGLKPRRR